MKKIIKYGLALIVIITSIIILKNFIIYATYDYDIRYLQQSGNDSTYTASLNIYPDGLDLKEKIKVYFFDDSTGIYIKELYYSKIDGNVYSIFHFGSLLPVDTNRKEVISRPFIKGRDYLKIFYKDEGVFFVKYKVRNNKLFLDMKNETFNRYSTIPSWGFRFNSSPAFLEIVNFWTIDFWTESFINKY